MAAERKSEPKSKPVPKDVRDFMAAQVAAGFESTESILQAAMESFAGDLKSVTRAGVQIALEKLIDAHKTKQAKWKRPTDCDCLDAAFSKLNELGLVARQNWTSCVTDGFEEIAAEMEVNRKAGRKVIGYCFYHSQDTELAVEEGDSDLMLTFGASVRGTDGAEAVGQTIVRIMEEEGLSTYWKGDPKQRIEVGVNWKKFRKE
ncbi:MAG: hypothetical protein IPG96_12685 [Proteobacteria bacterium]|nr:hypothetical protein [Pseudomonadota bacterium]